MPWAGTKASLPISGPDSASAVAGSQSMIQHEGLLLAGCSHRICTKLCNFYDCFLSNSRRSIEELGVGDENFTLIIISLVPASFPD